MSNSVVDSPPSHALRGLLRLPIWLYKMRLGRLLGNRFLLLQHTGRKSGRARETVLEVVRHDRGSDTYYVVSGWGPRSDWYLNTQAHPLVTIWVGGGRISAQAVKIPLDEAARILTEYSERYPLAFRELTQLFFGKRLPPGSEAGRRLAEKMPMVAFEPVSRGEAHP